MAEVFGSNSRLEKIMDPHPVCPERLISVNIRPNPKLCQGDHLFTLQKGKGEYWLRWLHPERGEYGYVIFENMDIL